MRVLTKQQLDALILACARAGVEEDLALQLAEQLIEASLFAPSTLAYMRSENLSAPEAVERFAVRVEARAAA